MVTVVDHFQSISGLSVLFIFSFLHSKRAYVFASFRHYGDESSGSILSPSDISYDNTEDDLV